MSRPKLTICQLDKVFKDEKRGDVAVLGGAKMEIYDKEFISIVGPSGCGKTTLLEIIAGIQKPTSGRIMIDGGEVNGPGLDRGMVFQEYALFPWQTIRKNVEFGPRIAGMAKSRRRQLAEELIQLVGLNGFGDHYPHEISGGMKQRAALARVLANEPDILLMDEPFAAIDAQMRETLNQQLLKIWHKKKKTVLFVTHSIREALFLADRIIIMSARPSRVFRTVTVDLPRPRNNQTRVSPEFHRQEDELRQMVWQAGNDINHEVE